MKRLLKSKKAQEGSAEEEGGEESEGYISTSKWALYIIVAIIIPLLGMIFAMFVTGYQVQENSFLGNVEDTVIQSRFFNSPECFAYQDSATGRAYPGVIDISKFSQERMNSCYNVPDNYINGCFKLELRNIDAEKTIGIAESENFGKCIMNSQMKKEPYYVLIKSGDDEFAGILFVETKSG